MLQHVEPNTLYLKSSSGLGNRICPILFATRLLGLNYFDRLIIQWDNMNCSQFQLSDIFNIISNNIQVTESQFDPPTPWVHSLHSEIRPSPAIPWSYCKSNAHFGYHPVIVERDRSISNGKIISQVLYYYPKFIQIRPELLRIANEFPINNEYIGIHCRRTDVDLNRHINPEFYKILIPKLARARDKVFSERLLRIIDKNHKVFIASDDQITKEYYKSIFPNSIIRDTKLPTCLWDIHPNPGKFNRWEQMLRQRQDIIDAFIELIILSRCKFIITDFSSSYAIMAHYLMGTKVYIINSGEILLRSKSGFPT